MLRTEKTQVVADIKELFKGAGAIFVTDYQGLNVSDMTVLRRSLRENQVRYLIAKNTLFKLAAKDAGVEGLDEFFTGPTAVAFATDDPSVAAKILYDSHKERDLPKFKAFFLEGQIHSAEEVKALAELPPKDVLLSQVAAAVESPLTELVGSIDGFFRELVGSLDALVDKKKEEE